MATAKHNRAPAAPITRKTKRSRDADFNQFADQMFKDILVCVPALPPADLDLVANLATSQGFVCRPWRFAALIASKDGAFFKRVVDDASMAKALAPCAAALPDFVKRLRMMADLADTVYARLSVAGCAHADFLDWMKEGEEEAAA